MNNSKLTEEDRENAKILRPHPCDRAYSPIIVFVRDDGDREHYWRSEEGEIFRIIKPRQDNDPK
jgi:hypothetical protein